MYLDTCDVTPAAAAAAMMASFDLLIMGFSRYRSEQEHDVRVDDYHRRYDQHLQSLSAEFLNGLFIEAKRSAE
jgi:hypothetical protein